MSKLNIFQQNNVKITGDEISQSIEIDKEVIDNGFLKNFPDSTLSIFLYLTTHIKNNNSVTIKPANISECLPFKLKTIIKGLNYLEENDIINVIHNENNPSFKIKINFESISQSRNDSGIEDSDKNTENTNSENIDLPYKDIIRKDSVSIKELTEVLVSFIPFDKKKEEIKNNINQWIEDFETEVLQELIRRVLKWQKNTNHTKEKAFYYMKAIIEDWYDKEVFTYDRLQYFDQLYRETRELANIYGVKSYNLDSVQMKTFKNWLTDDFALSLSVAKYAIRQAIKRKKDGQPSIQYIEDNFIKPWKKAEIRTVHQAKKYLESNRKSNNDSNNSHNSTTNTTETQSNVSNDNSKTQNKSDWDDFSWDLDELMQEM